MSRSKKTRAGLALAKHFAIMRAVNETNPIEPNAYVRECSEMLGDVRECSAVTTDLADGANPTPHHELADRQIAAARLLALGRTVRATAAEVGVEEHTVTRWRRQPAFQSEVGRQHTLILSEQVRLSLPRSNVDAEPSVADRLLRKYGFAR
jgi:transposase-like protein